VIMRTGYKPIDPILSIFVALLILRSAWFLVKDAGHILLEGVPRSLDVAAMREELPRKIEGITDVKDMHVWSLTDGRPMMTLEVEAGESADRSKIVDAIRHYLSRDHGVTDVTIEVK